jgi:enoyl-CoA hydratase
MSRGRVHLERAADVATITFDRPEARNAMTWEMYEELGRVLDTLEDVSGVRVAVLRGAGGKAFIAGTDIHQFTNFASAADGLAYEAMIESIVGRLEAVPIPTIAVIEGFAVGGGLAIAAACDLRICTPDARFGAPIARTVGNCLSMDNYARLCALIGVSRTKAMIFTAGLVPAEDAHAAGLVMEIVAPESIDERVASLCATLASHAPITLRVTKEALRRIVAGTARDGEDLVRETYGSRDFREGVAAFIEKRSPVWENR